MADALANKRLILIIAIIAVVLILSLWIVLAYNGAVAKEQNTESKLSDIKNAYTTKVTTLDGLLVQVQTYITFEQNVLTNITKLRTDWLGAARANASMADVDNVTSRLNQNYSMLFYFVNENYPELTSQAIVSQFMGEIVSQNDMLRSARSEYNEAVRDYNSAIKSFPMMLFSGSFGFEEKSYWQGTGIDDPLQL